MNVVRIAMWSGPRNISTAMLRAWENRPDTLVIDEPFYGFYLARTGAPHPGAAEVIAQSETDPEKIADHLSAGPTGGKPIFYQKQMTHHLLPEVDRGWLAQVTNCFLLRDPAEVICSYVKKNHDPTLDDLGFVQQRELFEFVRQATGKIPPVVDARTILKNPARTLGLLCEAIGVEFDDAMLSWPAGPRATDGPWAKHWYAEVEQSTGFQPYRPQSPDVPDRLRHVYLDALAIYEELREYRIR